jgi:hypothetical protein
MTTSSEGPVFLALGQLAQARGQLGPTNFGASQQQMDAVRTEVSADANYSDRLLNEVICIDDRLDANGERLVAPRLAGGGLSLALMYQMMQGGLVLSTDLAELLRLGVCTATHSGGCAALKLAPLLVPKRLSDPDADGYGLLESLGIAAPRDRRCAIARWASTLPQGYFDVKAVENFGQSEQLVGEHKAVGAAVCMRSGHSFVGGPSISRATGGLLAFAFDPWVAETQAAKIGALCHAGSEVQAVSALLAQVFTAEVMLELGGSDLLVNTYR